MTNRNRQCSYPEVCIKPAKLFHSKAPQIHRFYSPLFESQSLASSPGIFGASLGFPSHLLASHGISWHPMGSPGICWHPLAYAGIPWHCWHPMAAPGICWCPMGSPGICWILRHPLAYAGVLAHIRAPVHTPVGVWDEWQSCELDLCHGILGWVGLLRHSETATAIGTFWALNLNPKP